MKGSGLQCAHADWISKGNGKQRTNAVSKGISTDATIERAHLSSFQDMQHYGSMQCREIWTMKSHNDRYTRSRLARRYPAMKDEYLIQIVPKQCSMPPTRRIRTENEAYTLQC